MKNKSAKTRFVSPQIRELTKEEKKSLDVVKDVLCGRVLRDVIGKVPACMCFDNKDRPLVLDMLIVKKIQKDHGAIVAENLVINAHDWDFGLKNVDKKQNRINLIKMMPNSNNYLVLAANRENGLYIVTHYEVVSEGNDRKLKDLLKRGSLLDRSGVPSGAPSVSPIKPEKVSDDNDT
ncbi:MAG: hypothetical protein P4L61_04325 [Candidatus Pacebacteria bacterium]|nr:hypothetical protein [Candidatus Paceibacterota bacterium]